MKVSPGQSLKEIPSAWWNDLDDMRSWWTQQQRLGGPFGGVADSLINPSVIKIKNSSGADLARGKTLEIGNLIVTDKSNQFRWFDGDTPSADDVPFCVLANALPDEAIGPAFVSGVCVASVDVQSTSDTRATLVSSASDLDSDSAGPIRILNTLSTTGVQEVLVQLGSVGASGVHVGKLDANLNTSASGTMSIYSDASTDSGENITVLNLTGQQLKSGVWMLSFTPSHEWSTNPLVMPYEMEACP